jgi:hypothetical protein
VKIKTVLIAVILLFVLANSFAMEHKHKRSDKKPDCNIHTGPCSRIIAEENFMVLFDVNPRPVRSMDELHFIITIKKAGKPVTDAQVSLDLTMPGMFMGVNRPKLKHREKGRYEGEGVIPTCPHGGKLWKAEIGIELKGEKASVSYVFEAE